MAGIGAILAGVGTALSGAASAGSAISSGSLNRKNRKWQEKMYNLQVAQRREDAQAQYERTKDYAQWAWNRFESPTAQRAAMEAAGMNPFVEGSVIQPMGTPQGNVSQAEGGSVPSQGPYQNNPMSNIMAGASSLREAAMQGVQAENIQAQTELTNANRLKVQAETIGINKSNEILDIVKGIKDNELLSSGFRAAMDKIASQYAEVNAIADVNEKAARIQELNERAAKEAAEAAKTDSDRLISQYMAGANKRAVEAQANLADAQAKTEGAKKLNLEALTETENELRRLRKSLTQAQVKEIDQKIRQSRVLTAEGIEKLHAWMRGDREASNLFGVLDKYITGAGKSLLEAQYNGDVRRYLYDIMNGTSE